MKSNNEFRTKGHDREPEDTTKKAVKLPPIKKSGEEKHALYGSLDEDDDPMALYPRRESALDYLDDEDEEQFDEDGFDGEEDDDWDEEYGDEEDEDDDWG